MKSKRPTDQDRASAGRSKSRAPKNHCLAPHVRLCREAGPKPCSGLNMPLSVRLIAPPCPMQKSRFREFIDELLNLREGHCYRVTSDCPKVLRKAIVLAHDNPSC